LTPLVGRQEEHPACKDLSDVVLSGFCPERGADCLHVVPAVATAIPKPHCLLPHLNPDWFYLSGAGLPSFFPGDEAV